MIKVKGARGSWFASAEGEELPCVHEEWFCPNKGGKPYYLDRGAKAGEKKWDDFIEGIRLKKRVILTKDRWTENRNFERLGYKSIWKVDNITIDGDGLRFDFIERIDDAK